LWGEHGARELQTARKAGLKTMIGCMIETSVQISAAAHGRTRVFFGFGWKPAHHQRSLRRRDGKERLISFSTAPEKSWLCVRPRG